MARKKNRKGRKPPPKCKAILLCDHTIIEAGTGKVSIIGTFDSFFVLTFPGATAPFTAFLQMTDGIGSYVITVEVHDLQQDKILARADGPAIDFPNRSVKMNIGIPVPPLPVNHPGRCDFVVFADGQEIDRQQFEVHQPQPPEPAEGGHHAEDPNAE